MKKFQSLTSVILVIAFTVLCGSLVYLGYLETRKVREEKKREVTKRVVQEEIARLLDREETTRLRNKEVSKQLLEMVERDPDYVVVCLGAREARDFPGISESDEERILVMAGQDSAAALVELQKCTYEALGGIIAKRADPNAKRRNGWNNNNPATALLLVKLPIAQRMGKKKEMLRERLGVSEDRGFDGWIKDVPGNYSDWWYFGKWPWKDETPPQYWN